MHPETCPSEQELRAFQLGDLPEAALDVVAQHLEGCPRCETRAQRLDTAVDPILSALRRHPAGPAPQEAGPEELHTFLLRPGPARRSAEPERYPFLLPPAQPDEMGRLGNYRVLRLLGRGGMAFVFHAEDITLRRPVALKVMRPDLDREAAGCRRFLQEARILAAIKHEHLVTVYQAGQEGDTVYLAMELLQGESLAAWMDRGGRAPLTEVLRLGREIASGLAVVHAHGLVHRDVKPDNIWLEAPHGRVKLLDFGLARFSNEDARLTQGGTIVGTPSFMAPEQARGESGDARSDLYSLGVVLYYLCTGRKPFEGKNTMAVLTALAVDTPRPVHEVNPAVPQPLAELVMQLLARAPEQRPVSAEAVLERFSHIEACLADPAAQAGAPAPLASLPARGPWRLARLPRRPSTRALLAVLGLAVLAVAAWFLFSPGKRAGHPSVAADVPGATYLSGLQVVEPVHWPFPGYLPPAPPWFDRPDWPAPVGGHRVCVRGKVSLHGIFFHLPPPDGGRTSVTYRLGGRFRTFNSTVSLNDGPPACIPLTFTVYGDGRKLWQSAPVSSQADEQSCQALSVQGIDQLTLEVQGRGDVRGTHAVWVEPYLTE